MLRAVPLVAPSSSARSSPSSEALFARARLGDTSALWQLIARQLPRLHRWAHGKLHRAARSSIDTADLVQDAALHTLSRGSELDLSTQRALKAYLRTNVLNRLRDEHRKLVRHGEPDVLPESLPDIAASPLQHAITANLNAKYRRALARLHPSDQQLIVAHIDLGYSHAQLAEISGRSKNAARMALQRALGTLAEHMLKD